MKRHTLVAILLAVSLAASLALAQKGPLRLLVPGDVKLPYYARMGGATEAEPWQEIYHNDQWAAIVFYYEPDIVPPSFNLLLFYDFSNFPPGPDGEMTVAGFMLWDPETVAAGGPFFQMNLHGLGAVPVWFVSWPELQAAIADGELLISELGNLPSLRRGTASLYQEVLHPGKHIAVNAEGLLEDGKSFRFHATVSGYPPPDCCSGPSVQIRIW